MRVKSLLLAALAATVSLALPVQQDAVSAAPAVPRLVIYFQTTHDSQGQPISMLPLVKKQGIALTHLIVCSLHINAGSEVHLNDYPPSDARFYTLWNETQVLRAAGVRIMGMIGGAAPGSFDTTTLDASNGTVFEHYYAQLAAVIRTYNLQGMDLDVEQFMSDGGIARLVRRLHTDFGTDFEVTLAPVASALDNSSNLSGFDYRRLDTAVGSSVSFYNAQFYNGFGSMQTPDDYVAVVANGFAAARVLAGQITNPSAGYDFVPFDKLAAVVSSLQASFAGQFGGIMGWEYFNSEPGGPAEPWRWAQEMTKILRPNAKIDMPISLDMARRLTAVWRDSVAAVNPFAATIEPSVDYMAMVDA